jgi:2-oxo-4-hydroxy-4-carboxy-5-ureidoimidazoline decarboxylase
MTRQINLQSLNTLGAEEFSRRLGGIFEHSPWIAERVAGRRPFASLEALHTAMVDEVEAAGEAAQLALLRAHPELAGKAAVRGELTAESSREQGGVGLDQCTSEEFARLQKLNADYNAKFGFPFIVAVRGHTRASIIALFEQRLANDRASEIQECLRQVYRIGLLRLQDLLQHPA